MGSVIFSLWVLANAWAGPHSDVFTIKIYGDKVQVTSPHKWRPQQSVAIENKTLVKLLGKVTTNKKVLSYVFIKPGKFKTVKLRAFRAERVFFVSMAPAFQEIALIPGSKYYEIPPKN